MKKLIPILVPSFLIVIAVVPFLVAGSPILFSQGTMGHWIALGLFPLLFSASYVVVTMALSTPFKSAIIPGKFPRLLTDPIYGPRRIYGLCWGAVIYFTPIYYALLSVPTLRKFLLFGFGYRGHGDINIAPDAWIRDIPLLNLDQGAYVANKATMGTNICLSNGNILVDKLTMGKGAMVGHLTMLAPGAALGDRTEIGVGCAIGIRAKIGADTRIGPTTTLNHGVQIGSKVNIGTMSYIGIKARVADGLTLPGGANIPDGAEIKTLEDVSNYISSESKVLQSEVIRLNSVYRSRNGASSNLTPEPEFQPEEKQNR